MGDRVNLAFFPPLFLVAHGVKRPVVSGTKWHCPLVTHLAAHGPRLGVADVMGMARRASADQTGLGGHIAQVVLVPDRRGALMGRADLSIGPTAVAWGCPLELAAPLAG